MSGDLEQEYFADGMVDEIITGLSRIKWLLVTSRNSSFVYKSRPFTVKEVAEKHHVRYVLEGGVRKSGNRVRISAQLIDATTDSHLGVNSTIDYWTMSSPFRTKSQCA